MTRRFHIEEADPLGLEFMPFLYELFFKHERTNSSTVAEIPSEI